MLWQERWRRQSANAFRIDRFEPDWRAGLRAALIVGVPLFSALLWDRIDVGVLATLGALNAHLADPIGGYAFRARALSSASLLMTVALALATLVAGEPWVAVPAVSLWVFVLSIAAGLGRAAPGVAFVGIAIFVIGLGLPADAASVGFRVTWFVVGCAWATVASLAWWPLRSDEPVRRMAADAISMVSDFLDDVPHDDAARARRHDEVTAALRDARRALGESTAPVSRTRDVGVALTAAESVSRMLAAIDRALAECERTPQVIGDPIRELATVFARMADAVRHERAWSSGDLAGTVRRIRLADVDGHAAAARDAFALAAIGLTEHESVASLRVGDTVAESWAVRFFRAVDHGFVAKWHALRVAAVVAVAQIVAFAVPLSKTYWIPLTVVVVLKPDLGSTLERGLQRLVGSVVGALAAFATVAALGDRAVMLAAACVMFAAGMATVWRINYSLAVAGLTPTVILLLSIDDGGSGLVVDRLVDTLLGGSLAFAGALLLWPVWERTQLAGTFAKSTDCVADYLAHVCDESHAAVRRAHRRAEEACSEVEIARRRMLSEPRRHWIVPAHVADYCRSLRSIVETTTELRAAWLESAPLSEIAKDAQSGQQGNLATFIDAALSDLAAAFSMLDDSNRAARRVVHRGEPVRGSAVGDVLVERIVQDATRVRICAERLGSALASPT